MQREELEFIILAAGKSTRNFPHSKGIPHKSLVPFGSRKIIDHLMSEIISAGGKYITIVVSDDNAKKAFQECFKREEIVENKFKKSNNQIGLELLQSIYIPKDVNIKYVIQKEPKGLAHAIGLAAQEIKNRNLAIMLPDDIIITNDGISVVKKVVEKYKNDGSKGNLFLTRKVNDISRWGIVENGKLIEKPKTSNSKEAAIMLFILDKVVGTRLIKAAINADTPGTYEYEKWQNQEEIHHSRYLNEESTKDPESMAIRTFKICDEDIFLDCGTLEGYEKALLYTLTTTSFFREENREFIINHLDKICAKT
ncbi:MAG: sugar phosphate nucleotidyltransferase [Pseudomonadota bacterium]|nr:sugar phosphate nucleotidyltransferase [Pseudomonadota bacterium]